MFSFISSSNLYGSYIFIAFYWLTLWWKIIKKTIILVKTISQDRSKQQCIAPLIICDSLNKQTFNLGLLVTLKSAERERKTRESDVPQWRLCPLALLYLRLCVFFNYYSVRVTPCGTNYQLWVKHRRKERVRVQYHYQNRYLYQRSNSLITWEL